MCQKVLQLYKSTLDASIGMGRYSLAMLAIDIVWECPCNVSAGAEVTLESGRKLQCNFAVLADGVHSRVAAKLHKAKLEFMNDYGWRCDPFKASLSSFSFFLLYRYAVAFPPPGSTY